MACKIIRNLHLVYQDGDEIVAVLDSATDLAQLTGVYAPGSVAIVADKDGPVYMVNASGEWKEI